VGIILPIFGIVSLSLRVFYNSSFMTVRIIMLVAWMQVAWVAQAQVYPQQDFQAPMDTPLYLSAPFGSLRDNPHQ
jgi:hypothetical protein